MRCSINQRAARASWPAVAGRGLSEGLGLMLASWLTFLGLRPLTLLTCDVATHLPRSFLDRSIAALTSVTTAESASSTLPNS